MKSKKVAISQSNYIPWKGYFDIIAKSDVFVIYDEVQFTKNVIAERIYKFKTTYNLSDNFDFFVINLQLLSLTFMSLPYLFKNLNLLF